ncbi:[NiFe] hydrogenase nickel incorporation-associated protein HypB [Geminocystis sp. NIES-3708]|uniref:hydrogenase nickel incorporation protein HypB n=1 Tax=Geminocystis sp. NIES-3708 TaxID=1615909 RepID=UPI0005FCC591|nr:hydrogenase nickel incorporation protein HypB [Geminocystis sp. NIES-3708]BAQ61241.1 [NiFe] hydrogenase nickel incorporation-associated protein HypB [Geminocystis sp. NIES-3708]
MCIKCGCSVTPQKILINNHDFYQHHHHDHNHSHNNDSKTINIYESILAKNDHLAFHNRELFQQKSIFVLNILSSPGSGKTTFIEKTLTDLNSTYKSAVIVGDLATDNDAQRLRRSKAEVIQITTGDVCHLEAEMINNSLQKIDLNHCQLLIIENVGNLVCPASYDLGENERIVLLSVTEGEDKPLKYPTIFKSADVVIINKIDIAKAVEFNQDLALQNIKKIAPQAKILMVSSRSGEGINNWYRYIEQKLQKKR